MSSVFVSSQSYSGGSNLTREVAQRLGLRFVESEIYSEAARRFSADEAKLREAFEKAPSLFGMSDNARKGYAAFLQATLSAWLIDDNLAYHGPFAHAIARGVSHLVKVRIVAARSDRRSRLTNDRQVPDAKAERFLDKEDETRNVLAKKLFGMEEDEIGRFDLVVDTSETGETEAVQSVVDAIQSKAFAPMTYSLKFVRDLELGHRARAALIDLDPDIRVEAADGILQIRSACSESKQPKIKREIEERASKIDGVGRVEVKLFDNALNLAARR